MVSCSGAPFGLIAVAGLNDVYGSADELSQGQLQVAVDEAAKAGTPIDMAQQYAIYLSIETGAVFAVPIQMSEVPTAADEACVFTRQGSPVVLLVGVSAPTTDAELEQTSTSLAAGLTPDGYTLAPWDEFSMLEPLTRDDGMIVRRATLLIFDADRDHVGEMVVSHTYKGGFYLGVGLRSVTGKVASNAEQADFFPTIAAVFASAFTFN
jgi:hypothetical protein